MQSGTVLAARYRLDRSIGAGGMGQVWAARDEVLGREVAVKVQVVDPQASADLERFRRESQTAAALRHPNVVTIFDAGIDGGTAFLVMELLPGPDLEAYLAGRGVLTESEAVSLTKQVAAGLAAAHAAGVVHRDVKPANVVFQGPGTVKIVDFGIARLARTSAARLTATNTLIGSAPYLSPEQVEGRPGDERSDIYALGCMLTTMMTGRPPFEGDHPLAVMHQHTTGVAPRISERNPAVSASLDQLVSEMLRKSPDERPATCEAVIARLHGAGPVAGVPAAGGGVAATKVMDVPTVPLAVGGLPGRAGSAPGRRSPALVVMATVGAVLLVAVVAMVLLDRQGNAPSASPATASATATVATATPSTAPSTPDPGRSTPSAGVPEWTPKTSAPDLSQALSEVRSAVDAEVAAGGLDEDQTAELTKRVDRLDEKVGGGGGRHPDQQVQDMEQYVYELTTEGALSAAGSQRIIVALENVRAAL